MLKVIAGLKRMSASRIWPAKRDLPPCLSSAPAPFAVVVNVTASVPSELKSVEQVKQIKFTPSNPGDKTCESAPRVSASAGFGAVLHVAKAAVTVFSRFSPLTFAAVAGFRFHCTGKSPKSQRARVAVPFAPVYCDR